MEDSKQLQIKEVTLSVSNLDQSVKFWKDLLDMKVVSLTDNEVVLNYDPDTQTNLRLISTSPKGAPVDHATAFGRIAFSLPTDTLPALETKINEGNLGHVKTPLVVLDTPGKADVQVVILEDPVSTEYNNNIVLILNSNFES